MNRATFPILVASMLILMHTFPDGKCSFTTNRAGVKHPFDNNSSYFCCRCLDSLVERSSPSSSRSLNQYLLNIGYKSTSKIKFTCIFTHKFSLRDHVSSIQTPTFSIIFQNFQFNRHTSLSHPVSASKLTSATWATLHTRAVIANPTLINTSATNSTVHPEKKRVGSSLSLKHPRFIVGAPWLT